MTPDDFKEWRERLGLTKRKAAELLGLHEETVANYERGERRGDRKRTRINRTVALACAAVAFGLPPYGNPEP